METSGFWEGRKGKSHLEEKYSQATPRNCFPLGSSFTYCSAQDKGGSSKWDSIESLQNCVQVTISGSDGSEVRGGRGGGRGCMLMKK